LTSDPKMPLKLERLSPALEPLAFSRIKDLRTHFEKIEWRAPSLLLNIVSNRSGDFVGATNSSRDLSNPFDYEMLIAMRTASDGIFTTAKTARRENYGRTKLAPLALISGSGDFHEIAAVSDPQAGPVESLVFLLVPSKLAKATKKAFDKPWIRVLKIGKGSAFRTTLALTLLGWRRIIVESGPQYSRFLLRESAVKYVNLTIVDADDESPLKACQAALANLGIQGALLLQAERVNGTLFTRWTDF